MKNIFPLTIVVLLFTTLSASAQTAELDSTKVALSISVDQITIFPNPTTGIMFLSNEAHYKVLSIVGKPLAESYGKEIDLTRFENGYYFLEITRNGKTVTKKIVKK